MDNGLSRHASELGEEEREALRQHPLYPQAKSFIQQLIKEDKLEGD